MEDELRLTVYALQTALVRRATADLCNVIQRQSRRAFSCVVNNDACAKPAPTSGKVGNRLGADLALVRQPEISDAASGRSDKRPMATADHAQATFL
jgi:hypothetical protein